MFFENDNMKKSNAQTNNKKTIATMSKKQAKLNKSDGYTNFVKFRGTAHILIKNMSRKCKCVVK